MIRFAAAGLVLSLGLGGTILADDKALAELEGTFKAVAISKDGKAAPGDFVGGVTVKISADELTFTIKDKMFPAKVKVDAAKKPAHFDISPTDGPEKGQTFLGIYKVEKGELVLAFAERGNRPTGFTGDEGVTVARLKRDAKAGK